MSQSWLLFRQWKKQSSQVWNSPVRLRPDLICSYLYLLGGHSRLLPCWLGRSMEYRKDVAQLRRKLPLMFLENFPDPPKAWYKPLELLFYILWEIGDELTDQSGGRRERLRRTAAPLFSPSGNPWFYRPHIISQRIRRTAGNNRDHCPDQKQR